MSRNYLHDLSICLSICVSVYNEFIVSTPCQVYVFVDSFPRALAG